MNYAPEDIALFRSDARQMRDNAANHRAKAELYPEMATHLISLAEHYEQMADELEARITFT